MKKKDLCSEDVKKALSQIKQLCDFMLDETDTVEFSTTAKELDNMIVALESLRKIASSKRLNG